MFVDKLRYLNRSMPFILAMLFWGIASAVMADNISKISSSLQSKLLSSSSSEIHKVWIYFDSSAVNYRQVRLSEKSLKRRARVDEHNFLIDKNDYRIDESILLEIEKTGVVLRKKSRWFKAVSVDASSGQIEKIAEMPEVKKINAVKNLVRDNKKIEAILDEKSASSSKALALNYGSSLFQLEFMNAIKLHQAGLTGKGVTIGIFDSGFKTDHPAFKDSAHVVAVYDFINDDTTIGQVDCPAEAENRLQNYHGTLVMGVIAGFQPGYLIGAAYNADLVLAKTEITCSDTEIKVEEDNWIAAAEWADSVGVDIISSSVGYYIFDDSGSYTANDLDGNTSMITRAADIAASKNILVITSAGNERGTDWGHLVMPADGDSVIAVGAVTSSGIITSFSSPGPSLDGRIKPDIVTIGSGVYTARAMGGFFYVNGTSFATPLVAGACALAMEHDPSLTAEEMRSMIKMSGDRYHNPDNDYGYGLFDASKTADIIKFDNLQNINIAIGEINNIHLTTSGRSQVIPEISVFNLPDWIIFVDSGNGRASLEIVGQETNPLETEIGLITDVGYFSDTAYLTIKTFSVTEEMVSAGPNPFDDNLRIFINPNAGALVSVTIFNSAGEKVFEKVNANSLFADIWEWNGLNSQGKEVSNGPYLVLVKTGKTEKLLKLFKIDMGL